MIKAGIMDPAKVTITALQNAASAASVNLTADCPHHGVQEADPAHRGAVT